MNFFQRIGNALSRFMYGRNGVDRLGLTMIWAALLLDIVNMLLREKPVVSGITAPYIVNIPHTVNIIRRPWSGAARKEVSP